MSGYMMGNWANCGNLLSGGMKLDATTLYEYDLSQLQGPRATYLQRLADILPAKKLVDIFNQFPHTRPPDMFWPLVMYLKRKRSSDTSDTRANKRQRTDEMHEFRKYVTRNMSLPSELLPDVLQALQERDRHTYGYMLQGSKRFNRLPYLMTKDQCQHKFQWFWKLSSIPKMNPGIVGVVYRLNMTVENLQTGSFYYVFNQEPDKGLVFLLHADPPETLHSSIPWVQEIIEQRFWRIKESYEKRRRTH